MTLGLGLLHGTIINAIPSLPIHSSVIFVLVAGLFLAALVIRAQRVSQQAAALRRIRIFSTWKQLRASHHAQREATSERQKRKQGANMSAGSQGTFRIHWGRTCAAAAAMIALVATLVTAVLAITSIVSWIVPSIGLTVFVLSLVTLRVMAIVRQRQQRRRRIDQALNEAMNPDVDIYHQRALAGVGASESTRPFDALSSTGRGLGGPNSLQPLDEDGLPLEVERTFNSESLAPASPASFATSHQLRSVNVAPQAESDSSASNATHVSSVESAQWQPAQTPQPKYLMTEKAERSAPEPLAVESLKPQSDVKLSPDRQAAAPQYVPAAATSSKRRSSSMDLDEVLKRRRA